MKLFTKRFPASKKRLVIHCIGSLAFIVFASLILFEATKATVVLAKNGEKETVKTHSNTVEELLDELDIVVGEHDTLSYEMNTALENGMNVEYKEAKRVYLTVDGVEEEYYTTSETLNAFLLSEGISFSDYDKLSHDMEVEITDGLNLNVDLAFQVTINDGGKKRKAWTTAGSIKQLLDEREITLGEIDKVKPALSENLNEKTNIKITRVEKETDTVEEQVAFDTEKKKDNSLEKGKEKIISKGKKGIVVKKYEVTKENGKEVKRDLLDEKVKKKSKKQVVAIGTKEAAPSTVAASNKGGSKSSGEPSGKVFYMEATAYTADCNGCSGYTATGINLNANRNMKLIAVDPNVIPLGSKVWVEGYGNAIAGDTGGSIRGNRIDAHVPTKSAASQFGRKRVKVKIID